MKKMNSYAVALILLLFYTINTSAQNNYVDVTVAVNPPYSPYFSTYVDQPNMVLLTLRNTGTITRNVKLRVKIAGDNGVSISTTTSFTPSSPITLMGGAIKMLSFNSVELTDYFNLNNLNLSGVSAAQLRQNQALPEGNYSICVQALDYATSQPLSVGEPMGCAYFPLSYVDPPQVIRPLCGNDIAALNPQFVMFSWAPPATASGNIRYEFTLKEVPNRMNPYDVMKNNVFPVLFNTTLTSTNTFVYNNAYPQLEEGKQYAWRLQASAFDNVMQFKNQGLSEVCWFTYTAGQAETGGKPKMNPAFELPKNVSFLPKTTIKGKLQWSFRKSEEGNNLSALLATSNYSLDNEVTVANVSGGFEQTFNQAGNYTVPQAGSQTNTGLGNNSNIGSGSYSVPSGAAPSGNYFYQGGFAANIPDLGVAQPKSPNEIKQDKIDALAGSKKYPLQNTQVKVVLYPKAEIVAMGNGGLTIDPIGEGGSYGAAGLKALEIGTATTNASGEFSVTYYDDVIAEFYDMHLEIETKDFIFADQQIPFDKAEDGVYSFGTLSGLAKTFRLQLKNFEYNWDEQKGYMVKGEAIKGINITVTHDPTDWSYFWHPNLTHEGTRANDGTEGDLSNVQVAKGKDDYQIPRLFPNHYTGGSLSVDAAKEGYYSLKVGLNVSEKNHPEMFDNYLNKDVPVYVFENKMMGKDPVVKGKVLVEGTNAPVKDASVMIVKPEGGGFFGGIVKFATTNDKGEFEIADIPARDKPYNLLVSSGSIKTYTEEINLNKTALIVDRTILVSGKMLTIVGTVKDEDKNILKDAVVVWKTGGTPTVTNDNGRFVLSNIKGKHILVAKKPGFRDTELEVEVKEPAKSTTYSVQDLYNATTTPGNWTQTGSNQNMQNLLNGLYGPASSGSAPNVSGGNTGSLNVFTGYNNITNSTPPPAGSSSGGGFYYAQNLFEQTQGMNAVIDALASPLDIGDVILKRFYLKLKVTDAVSAAVIKGAKVEFNGEPVGTTNNDGLAILSNVAANTDNGLVIYGPDSSLYIASANNIVLDASKDTTEMTVQLKQGIKVSGKVSAAGAGVKEATVYVDGPDYIKTKTDNSGNYTLAVPAGNTKLWAVKSGFVGASKSQDFSGGAYTVDFTLKEAGFDASKLLGFDILLTESVDKGGGEFEITGNFINIPSNALFKAAANLKIPFHAQKVKKVGTGVVPSTGEILTDVSEIPLTLWDYLHLKLVQSTGLKVKPQLADNAKGKIEGTMAVDVNATFSGLTGIDIPASSFNLATTTGTTIPAFMSDGTVPFSDSKLKLGSTGAKWKVYDLTLNLDLNNTYISKEGLDIAGSISCDGFKFLPGLTMKVEQMRITTTGDIKNLKLSVSPQPKISIGAFELSMDHIDIGSTGLKLGGNLKVGFSGSTVNMGFSNLNVTKAALSGGTFSLSGSGIDLLGILKVGPGSSTGLTLAILPNGKDFNLTGNVNFNFNKYLNKAVRIDEFGISTTGNFNAKITSTVSVEVFGFAGLDITTLGVNTASKQVDLGGKIKFNVPGFGAGVGTTMHYKPGSATFDDFDINVSLGGIGEFSAKAAFSPSDEKFAGNGHVKIASSPLDFTAGFFYNKGSFGANFNMGPAVVLPIGPLSLDKIGGGFAYDKPASKFSVYGECRVKFSPDPYGAVELDPTKFGIAIGAGGPIFSASCVGKIVKIPFANANFVMDIPGRRATLDATAGGSFNLIPGMSAGANFLINAELGFGSDPYLFLGQAMNIEVPFLCNSAGGMAVAVNYYVDGDKAATYHLPAGGKYTGVAAWSVANIGRPESNPWGFDVGIGSVALWLGNTSEVAFHVKLNGFDAGFNIAGGWSAGAKACLKWLGCSGISAGASGTFSGNMDAGGIQNAAANLAAYAKCDFGCCNSNCGNRVCTKYYIPCGVKACVNTSVGVSYTKGSGFSFDLF